VIPLMELVFADQGLRGTNVIQLVRMGSGAVTAPRNVIAMEELVIRSWVNVTVLQGRREKTVKTPAQMASLD